MFDPEFPPQLNDMDQSMNELYMSYSSPNQLVHSHLHVSKLLLQGDMTISNPRGSNHLLRMVMEPKSPCWGGDWLYTPCSSSDVRWAGIPRETKKQHKNRSMCPTRGPVIPWTSRWCDSAHPGRRVWQLGSGAVFFGATTQPLRVQTPPRKEGAGSLMYKWNYCLRIYLFFYLSVRRV